MPEPGLSEIVSTTARLRSKVLKDNVRNNNAVLFLMERHGGMRMEGGGRTIVEELLYNQNGTAGWYTGGDAFSTAFSAAITAAEFDWKQLGGSVFITGRDLRMNSGKEQLINLLKGRFDALEGTLENKLNVGCLSDGTGDGGKQIIGLANVISKTPTSGTCGGIARTGNTFWQNYKLQPAVDIAGASVTSAANVKSYFNRVLINTTFGTNKPTGILAGATHYEALMTALQAQQIMTDPEMVKAGFTNVMFQGIPVVLGGGVSFSGDTLVPADLSYFINTKFLKLVTHKDANFDALDEVSSINQDAMVQLVVWMGAMTVSNMKAQGVLFDS